jgi:hypothetical protein
VRNDAYDDAHDDLPLGDDCRRAGLALVHGRADQEENRGFNIARRGDEIKWKINLLKLSVVP